MGKVTVLDGRPGVGKSCISLDVSSRVTNGRAMPNEDLPSLPASNVVLLTAEDDWADTVVPRLMVTGAELGRVFKLDDLDLPQETDSLAQAIEETNAKLVIIDPLSAFVTKGHDLYVDQHARLVLKPLSTVAEVTGASILVLRHLKKGQGQSAQDRGIGSVAIGGAARSNLIAGPDPDIEGQFALAAIKVNVAKRSPTLAYRIDSGTVELANGEAEVPVIHWGAVLHLTADDLVAEGAQGAAVRFLRDLLADGPKTSTEVKQAAEAAKLSWSGAVRRASERLRVIKRPSTVGVKGESWIWTLPDQKAP